MASDDTTVRVADFLDDRLQTSADLDALDLLLASVRDQYGLLRTQLEDAGSNLEQAKGESRLHAQSLQARVDAFNREQRDIDRRLRIIANSDASDDAVHTFEESLRKLRRLDLASGHAELLREADALSKESLALLRKSDDAALRPYRQLQRLLSSLRPLQDEAEGAAPHLLDHLSRTTRDVQRQIRDAYCADLEAVLRKLEWPKASAAPRGPLQEEWDHCVGRLLDFQMPELEAKEASRRAMGATPDPEVLLPLEVLVRPLETRFRYHFDGDRPTNRLDKPEYFLSHVADLVGQYSDFVETHVQPLLQGHFRGTDLAFSTIYVDAVSALITAFLPMLRSKVFSVMPKVAAQPQLLSHFMHEVMNFDSTIRDEWRYDGGYGMEGWKGMAWEILVQKDWFGRWLQVEKDFALARYENIIDTAESGELDFESVEANATKPSKQAIRVNDLLETITDRYRPLSSFSQKIRFLIDIQISISDRYHGHLHSGLEAYLAMTSSLGRTVQGISKEERANLQGVGGLDRLCRIYGSADYLERAMRDWSDDIFFLELWEELQDRARHSSSPVKGPLTVAEIASRTSTAVGTSDDRGALFDETAAAYGRLRARTESVLADQLSRAVRDAAKPYRSINPWSAVPTTLTSTTASNPPPPLPASPELEPLLTTLSTHLDFLSRALARAPLRRLARAALSALSQILWDAVLTRHAFSTAGAAQLAADLRAVRGAVDARVGGGVAAGAMRRVEEGARLVGLPVRGSGAGGGGDNSDEEGVEEEAAEAGGRGKLGLWEVERRLFASNEGAREVLEELGIETLTEAEARGVLGRRVELAG